MDKIEQTCDCGDWKELIQQVISLFQIADLHGFTYSGKIWNFCPWCGLQLKIKGLETLKENDMCCERMEYMIKKGVILSEGKDYWIEGEGRYYGIDYCPFCKKKLKELKNA